MRHDSILQAAAIAVAAFSAVSCAQEPPAPPDWIAKTGPSVWNFDLDPAGAVAAGWRIAETNAGGTPASWAGVDSGDPAAPGNVFALTQSANSGQTYNLAIAEDSVYRDVDLTVRLRADSGDEDQGGGPIWRCIDENNYYICRVNPLEENFRVYKVVQSKRTELASAKAFTRTGEWCTIRVTMIGNAIECFLDGESMLEVSDTTFPGPGLIGLWTKADAATSFDDVSVAPAE